MSTTPCILESTTNGSGHAKRSPGRPARQCSLIKPTGKRCGALAMRGKAFCYHHTGNHRAFTRERIVGERLDRLGEKLNAMNTAQLLDCLHQKLVPLLNTLSRFPEAGYALTYTLDRLKEITALESMLRVFLQQNQSPTGYVGLNQAGSGTCADVIRNQ